MADPEQSTPEPQEVGAPEVDPYSPEGAFGQWVKDVRPDTPQFEALSDRALREELEGAIIDPTTYPNRRDVDVAALGALALQEHNNRRLPGYVQASGELHEIIRTSLLDHHEAKIRGQGVDERLLESKVQTGIGGRLRDSMDSIVAPKATPPQSSPTA